VRKRLVDYWWIWLAVAVVAILANELIDRGTHSGSHPAADVLIAIAIVLLSTSVWELLARRRARRPTDQAG
jgi:hypothetical protein